MIINDDLYISLVALCSSSTLKHSCSQLAHFLRFPPCSHIAATANLC